MDAALLVAVLVALLVVEGLGIRANQKGRVDTVSELWTGGWLTTCRGM